MPSFCAVFGCSNRSDREKHLSYFKFPLKECKRRNKSHTKEDLQFLSQERRRAWVSALKRQDEFSENKINNLRVCSIHFISGKPACLLDPLNPDWKPTQNMGYISAQLSNKTAFCRHERLVKRVDLISSRDINKSDAENILPNHVIGNDNDNNPEEEIPGNDNNNDLENLNDYNNNQVNTESQTEISMDKLVESFDRLQILEAETLSVKKKLANFECSQETFYENNIRTKYFTGLDNFKVLFLVYDTIKSFLYNKNQALPTFTQLIITLMKLRLNFDFSYLAFRFGVTSLTISKYFRRCLHVLYCRFRTLVHWPSRDVLYKTMPSCFKKAFGNAITVIIDCFEVFTERPNNKEASAECWSNYKHHQTVKTLIGITPQGSVAFISDTWGGRTSDKYLTENSGFLELIKPGDVVMADRGFLIEESLNSVGAKLQIPAFTKGKSQLHPRDVEKTRKIANVRIHVERVIGSIRQKYRILHEALNGMEKVAEHINEMQRIHEEYGAIFDHLFRQHQKSCKQPIDLSPADLLYYGGVEWLNISDFLGKIKKGLELHAMCFVFKSAVVFLCKERLRQKKKLMGVATKNSSNEVEIIRYQVLIPVTEVQVRASSAKDMESHFLWELIHLRSQLQRRSEKVYVLSNSTSEFRNAFLKTIRQIIRESVRNMNIPSTKHCLSQLGMATTGRMDKSQNGIGPLGIPPTPPTLPSTTLGRRPPRQQNQMIHGARRKYQQQRTSVERESSEDKDADDGPSSGITMTTMIVNSQNFRTRSKTVSDATADIKVEIDPGTKSEGEEEFSHTGSYLGEKKANLGRTPNHLTLSTTSTISAGSTGSQAKLIHSSHQPENYQPPAVKDLGSPVWKPREFPALGEAMTLPRLKGKSSNEFEIASKHSASRKSLVEINNAPQASNFNNHI